MLETANKYWRPDEEELENDNTKEYLYEGEVKILGRVL